MKYHHTTEYKHWRDAVVERDGKCATCNSQDDLVAHHMNSGSYFIEERYKIDNGVTLCNKCHIQFHTNFKNSFRTKCTKEDFENFTFLAFHFKRASN